MRWGHNRKRSGVYCITNVSNGHNYVGASKDISMRLSTHFGREFRCSNAPLHRAMREYGLECFDWKVLEYCPQETLLENERKWYHALNPEYNLVEPVAEGMMFYEKIVRERSKEASATAEYRERRRIAYTQEKYRQLFSKIQDKRKKKVDMLLEGKFVKSFSSFMEAQRWLGEHTDFIGKNKASKVKAVCDGDRPSAFGYEWRYSKCND
jgi:group I intron endonuclease